MKWYDAFYFDISRTNLLATETARCHAIPDTIPPHAYDPYRYFDLLRYEPGPVNLFDFMCAYPLGTGTHLSLCSSLQPQKFNAECICNGSANWRNVACLGVLRPDIQ